MIASLKKKERKLLDLYYADRIEPDTFAAEHRDIATKLKTLQQEVAATERDKSMRAIALDKFDQMADLLANMDVEEIWGAATLDERKALVEDLVDSVCIYPDQLTVQVAGAPPIMVTPEEVGLTQGCNPVVSEDRPTHSWSVV